jgi:hypothetical protein
MKQTKLASALAIGAMVIVGGCSVNNKLKAENANLREQVEHMNNTTSDTVMANGDQCHTTDHKTPDGEHLVTTCRNAPDTLTYLRILKTAQ